LVRAFDERDAFALLRETQRAGEAGDAATEDSDGVGDGTHGFEMTNSE
jgi:hypothetical protein